MTDHLGAVRQPFQLRVAPRGLVLLGLLLAPACAPPPAPPAEPTGWTTVPGPQAAVPSPQPAPPAGEERRPPGPAADVALPRAADQEKWRPALEGYQSIVTPYNTTALNGARSGFATYIHRVHNRIHPMFADQYLASLAGRPKTDALNDVTLMTRVEIVLDGSTGKIVRMGVIKTSGVTAYDLTVLTAVDRAAPFGKAPDEIASADGNVYVQWEFHRDPIDACTTRNARPFMLKSTP
jgi:hypothetical protein